MIVVIWRLPQYTLTYTFEIMKVKIYHSKRHAAGIEWQGKTRNTHEDTQRSLAVIINQRLNGAVCLVLLSSSFVTINIGTASQ